MKYVSTVPIEIVLQVLADVQLTPKSVPTPPLTPTVFWAACAGAAARMLPAARTAPRAAVRVSLKRMVTSLHLGPVAEASWRADIGDPRGDCLVCAADAAGCDVPRTDAGAGRRLRCAR